MKVKIKKLHPDAKLPVKKYGSDFCYDVYACSDAEPVKDDEGNVIPDVYRYHTGLAFQIERETNTGAWSEVQYAIDARPRSSIYKTGLMLSNAVATIDEHYNGEVQAVFYHVRPDLPLYKKGDRIFQIKLGYTETLDFEEVEELSETDRGTGGFGSTGK